MIYSIKNYSLRIFWELEYPVKLQKIYEIGLNVYELNVKIMLKLKLRLIISK